MIIRNLYVSLFLLISFALGLSGCVGAAVGLAIDDRGDVFGDRLWPRSQSISVGGDWDVLTGAFLALESGE